MMRLSRFGAGPECLLDNTNPGAPESPVGKFRGQFRRSRWLQRVLGTSGDRLCNHSNSVVCAAATFKGALGPGFWRARVLRNRASKSRTKLSEPSGRPGKGGESDACFIATGGQEVCPPCL